MSDKPLFTFSDTYHPTMQFSVPAVVAFFAALAASTPMAAPAARDSLISVKFCNDPNWGGHCDEMRVADIVCSWSPQPLLYGGY